MNSPAWLKLLQCFPPEIAHRLTIEILRGYGALPQLNNFDDSHKTGESQNHIHYFGLNFSNRLGVAAGLDKNGEAFSGLMRLGFGAVEIGTVTPHAQSGNPLPRLFRLLEDGAIINRMGFNNKGIDSLCARLVKYSKPLSGVLGINIGANKNSVDPIADYVTCFGRIVPYADYCTINISSPNTPGLRSLQYGKKMHELLAVMRDTRESVVQETGKRLPILLKIAPDWDDKSDLLRLIDAAVHYNLDGVIVSNTTISRPVNLINLSFQEAGGLSGKPIFCHSTALLAQIFQHLKGQIPLIGVGGIFSPADALLKMKAGASLIQAYTGLTQNPLEILKILQINSKNVTVDNIFCSADRRGVIGCDAINLESVEKVRKWVVSQNDNT